MTAVDHDHAARLVTHLSQQRASGKYCDVCVCVAEQRFLAHKCVLSANSDQLDALILDATDEDNASHDIEIEIHGVSPVGFEIVLEYFYTGVLRLEPSTVTHTWMTAVYLGLPDIITRCNSYCQQSVTAHSKVSTVSTIASSPAQPQTSIAGVPIDLNNNGNTMVVQDGSANGVNAVPAQLSTSTILSSASGTQPKVNSTIKPKSTVHTKDVKPEPFEIRENPSSSDPTKDTVESATKKAKLLTMDESAIAWNPGQSGGVTLPVTSMPQVVVNLVQGYGGYQPVDINTWTSNGNSQQWAQVQVGKGQFVTGVFPVVSQAVKTEPVPTPATAVQIGATDMTDQPNAHDGVGKAGPGSPVSYTTLSLVSSQDSAHSESRTDGESSTEGPGTVSSTTNIDDSAPQRGTVIPVRELNLDNIHFTQINTDGGQQGGSVASSTSSSAFVQPMGVLNNYQIANADSVKCDTIMMQSEVEQLRIQHQQLQRLRLESGENGESNVTVNDNAVKAILATSKRKRKAPTRVSKSEDAGNGGGGNTQELHAHNNVRKTKSLAGKESVLVTITPEHMDHLYRQYPEIKKEPAVSGTCDVMQLLQHGKARQRKSSEQNALNNTIRTILDTTGIVDSGDPRVQDAVCLIMDRFTVLQEHMNDVYVRKQLTIKVKHSIHCKKWRLKRHKMKQLEMSSASISESQNTSWMNEPTNTTITDISDTSVLNDDSLHS